MIVPKVVIIIDFQRKRIRKNTHMALEFNGLRPKINDGDGYHSIILKLPAVLLFNTEYMRVIGILRSRVTI